MGIIYIITAVVIIGLTVAGALAVRRARNVRKEAQERYDAQMAEYDNARAAVRPQGGYGYGPNRPDKPAVLGQPAPPSPVAVSLVGAGLLAFVSLIFSATIVGAREVGIATALGTYQRTLNSGFQLLPPWYDVEKFSTRIQNINMDRDANQETDAENKVAIPLAFKGAGRGWGQVAVRWYIKEDTGSQGAEALWRKYKDFDVVRDTLVYPTARDIFRNVANTYLPVDALAGQQAIADTATADMNAKLARYGVGIDSVSITGLPLDPKTQESLDRINVAAANVQTAEQERLRAIKDAETASIREKSGILTPQGNLRYCLDVVNNWNAAKNGPLPAGWSCVGSSLQQVLPLK